MKSLIKPKSSITVVVRSASASEALSQQVAASSLAANADLAGQEVLQEIGMMGLQEIDSLRQYLSADLKPKAIRFRFAPSIVTRSEADLFGLSVPRFALRLYLDEAGSFVNARRVLTFRRLATGSPPSLGIPTTGDQQGGGAEIGTKEYAQLVDREWRHATCVGDSLLVPPARILREYHCLTSKLGAAYGEKQFAGTPFVRQISLPGGGLCAQAACFMATALLKGSHSIYGPAEVSFIAANDADEKPILSPLTPAGITRYFTKVLGGLSVWQHFETRVVKEPASKLHAKALRAYILAGIPVILPVNIGKMSHSILDQNGISCTVTADDASRPNRTHLNHVVVVVGCGKREDNRMSFLINDPATMPFLQATTQQLFECAIDEHLVSVNQEVCSFVAVAPPNIRVPLVRWEGPSGETRMGLITVSETVLGAEAEHCDFWLVELQKLVTPHDESGSEVLRDITAYIPEAVSALRTLSKKILKIQINTGNRWVWIQISRSHDEKRRNNILIWDAEQAFPTRDDAPAAAAARMSNLLGSGRRSSNGEWNFSAAPTSAHSSDMWVSPAAPIEHRVSGQKHLKVALVSSFSFKRLTDVLRCWPKGFACELTASQIFSVANFPMPKARAFPLPADESERLLAEMVSDISKIRSIAKRLSTMARSRNIDFAAMTTFLPRICAFDEGVGKQTTLALTTTVKLVQELQLLGHSCSIITLVAGTRVEGIHPFSKRGCENEGSYEGYMAQRLSTSEAICRLLTRLEPVANTAIGGEARRPVYLALELEPGPLFVLNDLASVNMLCQKLDRSPTLSQIVGLNLDIPHFTLAGIDVSSLTNLTNRIVHAHISDHARGHFSDCLPGTLGLGAEALSPKSRLAAFTPWIKFLSSAASTPRPINFPTFSGYISLNLEASGDLAPPSIHAMASLFDWA